MERRVEVGVLGATGMVGQQFIRFLQGHPWFEVTWLGASRRSAGKKYVEAANWTLDGGVPESIARQTVHEAKPTNGAPKLMFSAMDASVAGEIEQAFAGAGHFVVSNSRNHRMEPDVPLLIPEVNAEHLAIIPAQRKNRGWDGAIVTNPNCSTITMALGLAPLKPFGIRKILGATLQAISGAGYPGMPSMDIVGNVVPFIKNEEEKMESETQKILGDYAGGRSSSCPPPSARTAIEWRWWTATPWRYRSSWTGGPGLTHWADAIASYRGIPQQKNLPSAPRQPVHVMPDDNRPQPRKDALLEDGMAVSVGRIRECPILDYKMVILGHNTIRGAAGAAVLNAELLLDQGLLD